VADPFVHAGATVESGVTLGADTKIWDLAHVRKGATIGERCNVGRGVFIDFEVPIGDDCKIQNYVCIFHGVSVGRGVFIGPHAVFTNDKLPRATDRDFKPLGFGEWELGETTIGDGVAIGANATIVTGITIGRWAMVGAGAVVTKNVEPYALVLGTPARRVGFVCPCGARVDSTHCARCGRDLPSDHPLCS
jgi:UDP-2-acetamido-3-amino-2,3-dideoxy-glucuronate N-acetyltransferase